MAGGKDRGKDEERKGSITEVMEKEAGKSNMDPEISSKVCRNRPTQV